MKLRSTLRIVVSAFGTPTMDGDADEWSLKHCEVMVEPRLEPGLPNTRKLSNLEVETILKALRQSLRRTKFYLDDSSGELLASKPR